MTWATSVAALSPLAWWRMDAGSGTTQTDSSGNGESLTLTATGVSYGVAGALGASGDSNTAMTFSGSGAASCSAAGLGTAISGAATLSIGFWFNPGASWPSSGVMLEYSTDYNNTTGGLIVNITSNTVVEMGMSDASSHYNVMTYPLPAANAYHLWGITIDRTQLASAGAQQMLHIDGVAQTQTSSLTNIITGNMGNFALYVLARTASTLFTPGTLDEVFVVGTALTQPQWAALYTAGTTGAAPVVDTPDVVMAPLSNY